MRFVLARSSTRTTHEADAGGRSLYYQSYPKTTGGKGLHLVIPIERRSSWDEAQQLCTALCERFVSLR